MIEVECSAALDIRPVFGTETEEWPCAKSLVVEIGANVSAEEPTIAVAIRGSAVDLVRVDVGIEV